jgi:dipeptidyl aminopeptidase/acylaminoacyl peptidase
MNGTVRLAILVMVLSVPNVDAAGPRPMTPQDLWAVKRIGQPSISPEGDWCVVDVTTWDIDKDESSSNLWLLSTDGKTQKQLTTSTGKSGGPKWSPDGKSIAFVSQRAGDESPQIYAISPTGGEARRVSHMVVAPTGLKWAADSRTIYAIGWAWPDAADDSSHRAREKALKETRSKAVVIADAQYRIWDKWIADGKRPMIFAVAVETGRHRNLLANAKRFLPPTEPPPSANDYDISPDGSELCFVSDSAQDYGNDFNSDLFTLRISGAEAPKNITDDNPASDTNPVYSPDGKHLAFLRQTIKHSYADRQRLMVLEHDTGTKKELAGTFNRSCQNPQWADAKRLTFEAENEGVTGVYFTNLEGKMLVSTPPKLSERSISFGRNRRRVVYLQSSFDRPPAVVSHGPGVKDPIPLDHFNDALVGEWKLGKVESQTFKGADDKDVQQWIIYPLDFDATKKWPFVQVVHGGPHSSFPNDWSFRWNLQLWAAQGYVVGAVNFHGSSGNGQDFTHSIIGALGDKTLTDVIKSTEWFARQPWIDKNRMAAAGGSYGGFMMAWLNGHTDLFKAMVCHAGVYDQHAMLASDIVRTWGWELGSPSWADLNAVDQQSPQRFAAKFTTPTLVLHGERDFRVPITQGLAYFNTLRQKGVPTRLVYFPDENHWILKPNNSLVWHREVFAWLGKYIGNGPTSP